MMQYRAPFAMLRWRICCSAAGVGRAARARSKNATGLTTGSAAARASRFHDVQVRSFACRSPRSLAPVWRCAPGAVERRRARPAVLQTQIILSIVGA
jgi:hypothetical protein